MIDILDILLLCPPFGEEEGTPPGLQGPGASAGADAGGLALAAYRQMLRGQEYARQMEPRRLELSVGPGLVEVLGGSAHVNVARKPKPKRRPRWAKEDEELLLLI